MKVELDHKKFRQAREDRHLTQQGLAELTEMSDRYIREMEAGKKSNPSAACLFRLGRALGRPMEALMTGGGQEQEDGRPE